MRLGAALLLPPPLAEEVDGLRRALGDRSLERVPPHLTLVPPVNVRAGDLPRALALLRSAAATVAGSQTFELGPPATFLPVNPVVFLAVAGPLEHLDGLRTALLAAPLARPLTWPFVAHVTLAEMVAAGAAGDAAAALHAYRATATFDRVHLMEERRQDGQRRWAPLADADFGPPAIIGRGGLALELTRSQMLDPEAASLLESRSVAEADAPSFGPVGARLVVTGRREGAAVAVGVAWLGPDGGQVAVLVDSRHRRQGLGSHVLAAVELSVRASGWGCSHLCAIGPAGFYAARSHFSRPPM